MVFYISDNKIKLMKTLGAKVNDEVYHRFINNCKQSGITPSEKLRELVKSEAKLAEPCDSNKSFEHIKNCGRCSNGIIDKGYALVSLEELKKYNLVPIRNPV